MTTEHVDDVEGASQESDSRGKPKRAHRLVERLTGRWKQNRQQAAALAVRALQVARPSLAAFTAFITLLALVISAYQLRYSAKQLAVASDQLRHAIEDSNETQRSLGLAVVILAEIRSDTERLVELEAQFPTSEQEAASIEAEREALQARIDTLEQELSRALAPAVLPTGDCGPSTLNITEVMLIPIAPEGDPARNRENEYVELFNYGQQGIDVSGLFIADRGGHPGGLIAWDDLYRGIPIGEGVTDTTTIPPRGYGLILPPAYVDGNLPYADDIQLGTVVLTLVGTEFIGDGLVASTGEPADVLVLYSGTTGEIECVISTYGSPSRPLEGLSPSSIADDRDDEIPIMFDGFGGVRREYPAGTDIALNWGYFSWSERTPGR